MIAAGLTVVAPASAQQGPDDDPDTARGYVNNVFHHSSVDSINLYNGSLTIPIPIGPEYPVGPKLKFQAMLAYGSRVWEFGSPSPDQLPPDGQLWTPIIADPAMGIGWTFTMGAIKRCGPNENLVCYVGPDGSQHQLDSGAWPIMKTSDASQLVLKEGGSSSNPDGPFEMWDGDGNHYVFGPAGHVNGFDDKANPLSGQYHYVTDLGRGRDGWYLTSLTDPFGNSINVTYYSGLGALPCWGASVMRCASTGLTTSWIPHTISGPSWTVTVDLDPTTKQIMDLSFPVTGTNPAVWSFGYGSAALTRNAPEPASTSAVTLTSISLPTASYGFTYKTGPTANKAGAGGLVATMTLPTGGQIAYTWDEYSFYHARRSGLVNCTPVQPPTGSPILVTQFLGLTLAESPDVVPPGPTISGCVPNQSAPDPSQFVDKVQGVIRRTETLAGVSSNTDYVQVSYPFHEQGAGQSDYCNHAVGRTGECGAQTLTIMISPPSIDSYRHASATLFWASTVSLGGTPGAGDRVGAEIETRVFDFDPVPAAVSFASASGPACGTGQDSLFCPNHAVRVTQRVFDYDGTTCCNRRVASETTYHQPTSLLGVCTSCKSRAVSYSPKSTWESNGRHYSVETQSGDLGSGAQSKTTTTTWDAVHWTPPAAGPLFANLYKQRSEVESSGSRTINRYFEFDHTTGFLKSQVLWDGTTGYFTCRFPDGSGNADADLTDILSAAPGSPTTYCTSASLTSATPVGTDNKRFGKKYTYQNGQLLTARWKNGTTPAAWSVKQLARHSATGWITSSQDTAGVSTSYGYDSLGRVVTITPTGETATNVSYDLTTQTTVTRNDTAGLSTWQQFQYDGLGRLIRELRTVPTSAGVTTVKRFALFDGGAHDYFHSEWVASTAGESISSTVSTTCKFSTQGGAEGNFTTNRPSAAAGTFATCFDPFGRPQKLVGANHNSIQTIYRTDGAIFHSDSLETLTNYCVNGNFTGATCNGASPLTPITTTRRDLFGRILNVTEPNGDPTTYTYDVIGKVVTVTQGAQSRAFSYDAGGNLASENTPEKKYEAYKYGGLANLLQVDHKQISGGAIDLTTTRTYDFAGRMLTVVAGSQTFVSNCYDGGAACTGTGGTSKNGKLTRRIGYNPALTPAVSVTQDYTYSDPTGRLSQRATTFSGGGNLTAPVTEKWAYNSLGLTSNYWHPRVSSGTPFVVSTGYDQGLPVTEYLNGMPMVKSVNYLKSGALAGYTTGLGTGHDVVTTITQDSTQLPRPASIATSGASVNWLSGSYIYDGATSVVSMGSDSFSYDDRSRLTVATLNGVGSQYYCYDRWGNRISKSTTPPTCGSTTWPDNRVPPGTTNYDTRGNMISNVGENYLFDNLDRQYRSVGSTTWNYRFDAASERVIKVPPTGDWTYTLRDEANRVSTEYAGSATPAFSRDEVFLGNLLVASYANTAVGGNVQAWQFYSSDHLGSPRLITDIAGTKLDGPRCWPYGDEAVTQAGPQRVRFAAMERDMEASRYYDHARSEEFTLGRFLSPDPVILDKKATQDPQFWNRYAYVGNNPVSRTDSTGKCNDPKPGGGGTRVCIQPYIAGGTFGLFRGDGRGPDAQGGTFRASQTLTLTPGGHGAQEQEFKPGVSSVANTPIQEEASVATHEVNGTPEGVNVKAAVSDGLFFGAAPNLSYDLTLKMGAGGDLSVSGTHSAFPSLEVWQYKDGEPAELIYRYDAPAWNVVEGVMDINESVTIPAD